MPVYVPHNAAEDVLAQTITRLMFRKASRARSRQTATTYRDDPVAWVHDCLDWEPGKGPTKYQDEILAAVPVHKRISVRGPHGLGKTALQSWISLWFATTRDLEEDGDWKTVTTAGTWRQLTKYLWPEIRKWMRKIRWDVLGREPFDPRSEMLSISLKLANGEAFAVASSDPGLIEGAHARHILYQFDESKSISASIFDAAEGALSTGNSEDGGEAYAVAMSTPGEPSGRFYEIQSRSKGTEDWWVRHVTLDEVLDAKRVSREWVEARRAQWGDQSAVFQNRVLGEFATSSEDAVIPLAWVELSNERWRDWHEQKEPGEITALGVDVARSGEDKSVIAIRNGNGISDLRRYAKLVTTEMTGRVTGILETAPKTAKAVVDVIGIGAGVVDQLREGPYKRQVVAFNASERSETKDRSGELGFINKRSAAWWNLREMLDPANGENLILPPDDLLIGDLTAPHWDVRSGGKIQIESKDDIRERIGRSTDTGDAVVMAFALEITDPLPGIAKWYARRKDEKPVQPIKGLNPLTPR